MKERAERKVEEKEKDKIINGECKQKAAETEAEREKRTKSSRRGEIRYSK